MLLFFWLLGAQITILTDEKITGSAFDFDDAGFPADTQTHRFAQSKEKIFGLEGALMKCPKSKENYNRR
jgi:hypothetical protein